MICGEYCNEVIRDVKTTKDHENNGKNISQKEDNYSIEEVCKGWISGSSGDNYDYQKNNHKEMIHKPQDVELVFDIIELYKSYPILWDFRNHHYRSSNIKDEAYNKIVNIMNETHDLNLSTDFIKNEIKKLRRKFFEEEFLHRTNKKPASDLWYFTNMSFLINNPNRNEVSDSSQEKTKELMIKEFEENEQRNSDFIQIFKKMVCLWDKENRYYANPLHIEQAYNYLITAMKTKWNYSLTEDMLKKKIALIRFLSKEINKITSNDSTTEPWYFKELEFLKEKEPKVHFKKTNSLTVFTCEFCNKEFNFEKSFRDHQYEEYGITNHMCNICNKSFKSADRLRRHLNIHVSVKDRPYECKYCGLKFSERVNLSVHTRRHTKNYTHECKECKKKFCTTSELKTHMRNHSGETPYVCDECGKAFRFLSVFMCHRNKHFKNRIYKCTICPKAFYQQGIMSEHIKSHSDLRNNICDICGKGFKLRKTLRQHKQIHSAQKQYVCKICGREYSQAAGLHGHMKTHQLC